MRSRTRMIATAVAVTAALAAGSGAAVAATAGGRPAAPAKTRSAEERQGHGEMTAAVARELHVSTAAAGAALRPLFAAGRADTSSPMFAAAARSLGVSAQQLNTALVHAKLSLITSMHVKQRPSGAKAAGAKAAAKAAGATSAEDRQGHNEMTAAVARELHVSTAAAGAALRPLFAAGHADTSSPMFAAAARSLGVSAQQLNTALMHAKQSLAAGQ